MTHVNAPMMPEGRRRLAVLIVEQGWSARRAAERFQVSPTTAARWAARYRAGEPMSDRSSRPARTPTRCSQRLERRIIKLRYCRRWGPHRIAYHLGVPRSTVGRVLVRYRMPLLAHIDQATGLPVRKRKAVRYEAAAPGDLVHVDIKKQGRIPAGGGWKAFGRGSAQDLRAGSARDKAARRGASPSRGYAFHHHAVDDHSRLAYSEILGDERKETAAEFWKRARGFFAEAGIEVKAVMTDNGACYRSHVFAEALG
ncbi:helix-turn-helix domain-containing protein, partial [Aeromicrobium terrae]